VKKKKTAIQADTTLPVNTPVDAGTVNAQNVIQTNQKPKKPKIWKWILIVGAVVAGLLGIICTAAMIWYSVQLAPKSVAKIYHVVEIKSGESTGQIAQKLQNTGVINSARAFSWFVRISRINNLQAGTYRLSSADTTPEIARSLENGKVSNINLLILPGQRLSQIKNKLVEAGYAESEIDQALFSIRSHPLLKNISEDAPLEGYLFPDTYNIAPYTSVKELFNIMLNNFQSKITPSIKSGLKRQGLTLEQGIILASIVQKEVADPTNEKIVAQVFLKRLKDGNVLGSDVTYQYAAAETGQTASPELDSPYNTRKVVGLPPTAIANFDISALNAVANPAKTNYNYFVAGDDGKVYFSKTEEEHIQLTRQHCASCFQ
jgi:UPF0755 protein